MKTLLRYLLSICLVASGIYAARMGYALGVPSVISSADEAACCASTSSTTLFKELQPSCMHAWFTREKPGHVIDIPFIERRETEEDEDEFHSCHRFGASCIATVYSELASRQFDANKSSAYNLSVDGISSSRYLILRVFRI